jgi:hypothetical protein
MNGACMSKCCSFWLIFALLLLLGGTLKLTKVMTEIDTNKNGFIELREFVAWCSKTM